MFEIPENLPLSLSSLGWLVGHWQGWGVLTSSNDQAVVQDIHAEIVGEHLRVTTSIYRGEASRDIPPEFTAAQGLEAITAGELAVAETSYWRVSSPLAALPADDESPREISLTSADTRGLSVLWVGAVMGPRVTLASDVIAREPSAPAVDRLSRMYGLVGGELMWTTDRVVADADPVVELTGRLMRVHG